MHCIAGFGRVNRKIAVLLDKESSISRSSEDQLNNQNDNLHTCVGISI